MTAHLLQYQRWEGKIWIKKWIIIVESQCNLLFKASTGSLVSIGGHMSPAYRRRIVLVLLVCLLMAGLGIQIAKARTTWCL